MSNLFKTRFVPNPDGTDSAIATTNANSVFIHTYVGDDFSGDGTREYPFKSAFKANQKGVSYIVFRGVINEAFSTGCKIIGDDINQQLVSSNYSQTYNMPYNLTQDTPTSMGAVASIIQNAFDNSYKRFYYCLLKKGPYSGQGAYSELVHVTSPIGSSNNDTPYVNNILFGLFNATNSGIFSYCLILSDTVFKFNNTVINGLIWTNDSKANIQILRNAYISAGMSQSYSNLLFAKDSFENETCRIVKEVRNGGTSANIFNSYNLDGTILDYSLNPQSNNEALYASDLGGYVGCFKPATAVDIINDLSEHVNVDDSGNSTAEQGLLLFPKIISNVKSIEFDTNSGQKWNRSTSLNTISIPNGIKYNGSNIQSDDGSAFGYYFGKYQNLMNATPLYAVDTLEPNSIYKVCNINRDIYSAIIFNGTQYLPDYFFKTSTDVLNFTLLNGDSGTNVKKVLATPLESIEIIPYDDLNTPSTNFPRYSAPFFGDVQMLFHKVGVNIDKPVLFSEVENDKISYYYNWAVTNADQEFVTLANDTENYYYKIPILKFLRIELNGHFNVEYDQ